MKVSFTEEWYSFCAVMQPDSVRLGRVWAFSFEDAKAKVQRWAKGGFFWPNQIYAWPERDILEINNTKTHN